MDIHGTPCGCGCLVCCWIHTSTNGLPDVTKMVLTWILVEAPLHNGRLRVASQVDPANSNKPESQVIEIIKNTMVEKLHLEVGTARD